MILVDIITII